MRTLSPTMIAILESRNFTNKFLFTLHFSTGPVYLIADKNIKEFSHDGVQYIGGIVKVDSLDSFITKSTPGTDTTNIELIDADQSLMSLFLSDGWQGFRISVDRLLIGKNGDRESINVWKGYMDSWEENQNIIKLQCASIWADFDKVSGRKTNSGSQQCHYPNDKCFDETPHVIKDQPWGRANPSSSSSGGGDEPFHDQPFVER